MEVKKLFKCFIQRKINFLFPIIAIALLLLVLSTNHALSSSKLTATFHYNGAQWSTAETFPFEEEWITTEKEVEFILDLSHYLDHSEELTQPFELGATYQSNPIESQAITPIESAEGEFSGEYHVTYLLPEEDGLLEIGVNFNDENEWSIPVDHNPVEFSIIKDTQVPEIVVLDVEDQEVLYQDRVEFQIEVTDPLISEERLDVSLNGEKIDVAWNNRDETYSASHRVEGDGVYQLAISARDRANHEATEELTFYLNNQGPTFDLRSQGQSIENKAHVTNGEIELHVSNHAPIENVDLDITKDGDRYHAFEEAVIEGTSAIFADTFEEGAYQLDASVEDANSDKNHLLEGIEFVVDQTAPQIEASELDEYYNEDVNVEVTITEENYQTNDVNVTIVKQDPNEEVEEFALDWGNTGKTSEATYTFDQDGYYQMLITATDKAGNQAERVEREFIINRSAPELIVEGVKDGDHYHQAVEVDLSVTGFLLNQEQSGLTIEQWDPEEGEFFTYPTENEPTVGLNRIHLNETFSEEGVYQLHLTGVDLLGNEARPKVVQFTIDKVAPVVAITGVEDGEIYGDHQILTFSVLEKYFETNDVTLSVTRNGKDFTRQVERQLDRDWMKQGETSEAIFETNRQGNYTFTLEAEDAAGNQAEIAEKSFIIDSSYPTITVEGVEDGAHYGENPTMKIEISDRNLVEDQIEIGVLKDGEAYDVGEFEFEGRLIRDSNASLTYQFTEEGTYQVLIEATDRSNNQATKKLIFTIDQTEPIIELGKDIPDFVTSETIEGRGINEWIPIDIYEKYLNKRAITIKRLAPSKDEEIFVEEDFGSWEQADNEHYFFNFNDDFFTTDGDYQLTIEVSDLAGHVTQDTLSFTIDNTEPVITLSDISRYNNEPVSQEIKVIEHNYQNNDVVIDIYRENSQGRFVEYDHPDKEKWHKRDEASRLSLDFEQDGTYRVEVRAVDAAGNKATPVEQIFTIDQVNPLLSLTGVTNDQHYNKNRKVTAMIEDENIKPNQTNLTVYRLNESSGKMERYRSIPALTFNEKHAQWQHVFSRNDEGVFEIHLDAIDRAGNRSELEPITFTIDQTAPVLQANQIVDGEYYGSTQEVEFVVRERHFARNMVDFEVTRNGQNITSTVEGQSGATWRNAHSISRLNYHFNQDGAYTISMGAYDAAGNVAVPVDKSFVIDTVNPVIEIQGVENSQYYNMDRPASITVRDVNLDQQTIRVTRDGVNYPVGDFQMTNNGYQESIATLNHTFSEEGVYEIFVEAVDQAGRRDQMQLSFTIDKTAPVITPRLWEDGSVIEDGSYINHIFTPVFELDNPDDQIDSVTLNGGSNIVGNIPIAGQEMTYYYSVVASDHAGNTTELDVSFTVDTTMPALTISGIIDGYFNEAMTPTVEYSDENLDTERTTVTLNGAPFVNGTILDQEQDYILRASIADLAENVTEQTIVFTIDKTEPTIRFSQPLSDQYFNQIITPEFFIEDMTDYEIIALNLNGQPYELGQPIETEGKHVLYFEVMDRAGNIKQLSVEFIIDTTAPEFIVEGAEHNKRYYEDVVMLISLLDQEDVIQTITVNGEDYPAEIIEEENGQLIQLNFQETGTYHVRAEAYDLAGNETSYDLKFEIAEKTTLMKWYENRPLFASSVFGLLAIAGMGIVIFLRKRNQEDDVEQVDR